jgi:hypothetical protein
MGIHDDEFPDEHHHYPQQLGEKYPGIGVFTTDYEGRHYYLEVKLVDDGIVADVFDRYGDELLDSWGLTYDELMELVTSPRGRPVA